MLYDFILFDWFFIQDELKWGHFSVHLIHKSISQTRLQFVKSMWRYRLYKCVGGFWLIETLVYLPWLNVHGPGKNCMVSIGAFHLS